VTAATPMRERDLQAAVVELARRLGWLVYHTHDSRHSQAGFPDVCAVRRRRLLFAELKAADGRVTFEQDAWLSELTLTDAEVYVWGPDEWRTGEVERALR
jgi:VRR-NUC domain